mgnify:CR=1 FL=1
MGNLETWTLSLISLFCVRNSVWLQNIQYISFQKGASERYLIILENLILTSAKKDLGGSMRIVEMLYKTNLFVMVGGDPIPKYPQNKVYFWDDYQGKFTAELTFKKDVKSVKLTQNK